MIYLLNLFDYLMTVYWASRYGTDTEANPISRYLLEHNCLWVFKVVLVGLLLLFIKKYNTNKTKWLVKVCYIVYSMLAFYHIVLIIVNAIIWR